jgi:hypothetical protein
MKALQIVHGVSRRESGSDACWRAEARVRDVESSPRPTMDALPSGRPVTTTPNVVLMDARMPELDHIAATAN